MRVSSLSPALILLCLALPAPALAQGSPHAFASPWVKTAGAEVRLIAAPVADARPGVWQSAGLEIRLEHSAKTYWRAPGDTGVPPTVAFANSKGVADLRLQFPAPIAFSDEAGGMAIGYREGVIFPIWYKFAAPPPAPAASGGFFSRKVEPPPPIVPEIAATIDFGVCVKAMCMPAQAAVALTPGKGVLEAGLGDRLMDARRRVPVEKKIGDEGDIGISAIAVRRSGETVDIEVSARVGADIGTAAVFVEGKDGYVAKKAGAPIGGSAIFRAEARAAAGTPLGKGRITLVTANQAIEVMVDLDAGAGRP